MCKPDTKKNIIIASGWRRDRSEIYRDISDAIRDTFPGNSNVKCTLTILVRHRHGVGAGLMSKDHGLSLIYT